MKNIGIFLGYSPEQSIRGQGISRLLTFILNGILKNDDARVAIATPAWFKQDIIEFLQEENIDVSKIELITTDKIPFIIRLRQRLKRKKSIQQENVESLAMPAQSSSKSPKDFLQDWFANSSIRKFLVAQKTLKFAIKKMLSLMRASVKKGKGFLTGSTSDLRKISALRKLYKALRKVEFNKLTALINQRPDIPVWFTPALFWPEVKDIHAKKIIAAPDVVLVEFPEYFKDAESQETYDKVATAIAAGDHFICYSEYVKQHHLVKAFSVPPDKVSVIPHGLTDLSAHLQGENIREQSIQILRAYQKAKLQNNPYLADFDLSEMRYLFYSSQLRPYKNFRNLIDAYEILLRERFVNIKLVVTADIAANAEIHNYILSKRLQFDVLSFSDVPGNVLAALNCLATCAVNPTLFEGGFPFTFTEAYSVGTPSIMSAIPVVSADVRDAHLQQAMLFDPHSIDDMVNKIEWAVNHSDELFALQQPLYQHFKQRCWGTVAKDYVNLLSRFAAENA